MSREILHSSKTFEWYTPKKYIDSVKKVLGSIDLDPASSFAANQRIHANHYFDINNNGLEQSWNIKPKTKVFLNPPYNRQTYLWVDKIIHEYITDNIYEAILLVNAVTDRKWFQKLWNYYVCLTDHRIKFYNPDSIKKNSPVCGSAFVYFGEDPDTFIYYFEQYGKIVIPDK